MGILRWLGYIALGLLVITIIGYYWFFVDSRVPSGSYAIDMAQVALQFAKDAEIRRIAQKTIDDQKKDIEQLQSWLQRHPAATGASTGK